MAASEDGRSTRGRVRVHYYYLISVSIIRAVNYIGMYGMYVVGMGSNGPPFFFFLLLFDWLFGLMLTFFLMIGVV